MSKRFLIAAVIVCIFIATLPAAAQLGQGSWPKHKSDMKNSGRSSANVIAKPAAKWEVSLTDAYYTSGNGNFSGPVIDSAGNIYVIDRGSTAAITKVSPTGAILWHSTQGLGSSDGGPTLWSDGTNSYVIAGPGYAAPGLYAINPADGTTAWSVTANTSAQPLMGSDGTPAVGPDGTIYIHELSGYQERGKLTAIDPVTQTVKWQYYYADDQATYYGLVGIGFNRGTPVVTTDGSGKTIVIIAGSESGWGGDMKIPNVYAIRDDGATPTMVWGIIAGYHQANPVLSNDGTTLYENSTQFWGPDNFKAINVTDGTTKWSIDYPVNSQQTSPVIGADGTIYACNDSGRIIAVQDTGTAGNIKWSLDLPGGGQCTTPAVITGTAKPVIYVGTSNGTFFAVQDDGTSGTVLWTYRHAGTPGTPAVAADGTVVMQWDDKLVALEPGFAGSVPQAKINGYVKDSAGNPIANAVVAIATHPNPLPDNDFGYVITDASGRYELGSMDTGTYYVAAWARGWHASADATAVLSSPVDIKSANFSLAPESVNLIIGATATTNNADPDPNADAKYAIDGDFGTRFASSNASAATSVDSMPTQLLIDLGANRTASEMLIYWEWSWAKEYKVQCLPDSFNPDVASPDWDTNGTVLYSTSGGKPCGSLAGLNWWTGIDAIQFAPQSARYWRIYATKAANTWCMSVYELELHDSGTPASSIADLRSMQPGTETGISGKQLTASVGGGIPSGNAYIEEPNRASAIRIDMTGASGNTDVAAGDTVDLIGTVQQNADGEKYVAVNGIAKRSGTSRIPDALGMNNRAAGMTLAQGLLVKLWGKVSNITADSFDLADGSGTAIKVICGDLAKPTDGQFIRARGVVSKVNGTTALRMRGKQVDWVDGNAKEQPLPLEGQMETFRDYLVLGLFTDSFGGGDVGRDARMGFDYIADATSGAQTESTIYPELGASIGDKKWVRYNGSSDMAYFGYLYGTPADCAVYAHVYVWSPIDQFVDLALGSDDAVKVWVNGSNVWSNSTWSGLGYDRDVVSVPLNAGVNRILFKIVNGTGDYGVVARLAEYGTGGMGAPYLPAAGLGYLLSSPAPQQ